MKIDDSRSGRCLYSTNGGTGFFRRFAGFLAATSGFADVVGHLLRAFGVEHVGGARIGSRVGAELGTGFIRPKRIGALKAELRSR